MSCSLVWNSGGIGGSSLYPGQRGNRKSSFLAQNAMTRPATTPRCEKISFKLTVALEKSCLASVVLCASILTLIAGESEAQSQQVRQPDFLDEMPSVERIQREVKGEGDLDTKIRQIAAYEVLRNNFMPVQGRNTPGISDRGPRYASYAALQSSYATQEIRLSRELAAEFRGTGQPSADQKAREAKSVAKMREYISSTDFRKRLLMQFFSPGWITSYQQKKDAQTAGFEAGQRKNDRQTRDSQAVVPSTALSPPGNAATTAQDASPLPRSGSKPAEQAAAASPGSSTTRSDRPTVHTQQRGGNPLIGKWVLAPAAQQLSPNIKSFLEQGAEYGASPLQSPYFKHILKEVEFSPTLMRTFGNVQKIEYEVSDNRVTVIFKNGSAVEWNVRGNVAIYRNPDMFRNEIVEFTFTRAGK